VLPAINITILSNMKLLPVVTLLIVLALQAISVTANTDSTVATNGLISTTPIPSALVSLYRRKCRRGCKRRKRRRKSKGSFFKRVGKGIKKGVKKIGNHIVKTVKGIAGDCFGKGGPKLNCLKTVGKVIASTAINAVAPGVGTALSLAASAAEAAVKLKKKMRRAKRAKAAKG
jgi:hypothetical protein